MENSITVPQDPKGRPQRQTICSRLRRMFKGSPKPEPATQSSHRKEPDNKNHDRNEKGLSPYQHVPRGASSSFLRTTTKKDMFELTGSGRKGIASGEASAEASGHPSLEDLTEGQSTETRPALIEQRTESRLRHTEALEQSDSIAE